MTSSNQDNDANANDAQNGVIAEKLRKRAAKLQTGSIETTFAEGVDSELLFGFGERINPRRSFVFVSRVLGRHIPVTPTNVRQSFTGLAQYLPNDLPGPILMTSMAETAVGLGAGVHDAYLRQTERKDVLNVSSTRAQRDQALFARFSEDHSHASGHCLYLPSTEHDRELLKTCRSLVMVDDETSSGNTMKSLGQALHAAGISHLEHVYALTLTDWSSSDITVPSDAAPSGYVLAQRHALLNGTYHWHADEHAPTQTLPDPDTPSLLASQPLHRTGDARIGNSAQTPFTAPQSLLVAAEEWKKDERPVLVLGTGEHVWEPLLLAEALEQASHKVLFSSTTRSPIKLGHDIHHAYSFNDHEGLGITNYLYNVNPDHYSSIIVCLDTSVEQVDQRLIKALRAHILFDDQFIKYEHTADNIEPLLLQQLTTQLTTDSSSSQ